MLSYAHKCMLSYAYKCMLSYAHKCMLSYALIHVIVCITTKYALLKYTYTTIILFSRKLKITNEVMK